MAASDSRFKFSELIDIDGVLTYGRWVPPSFMSGPSSKYIVSNAVAGRPDLISQEVYRTPRYHWAIIAFNGPSETLDWPKAGDEIDIPDIGLILSEL